MKTEIDKNPIIFNDKRVTIQYFRDNTIKNIDVKSDGHKSWDASLHWDEERKRFSASNSSKYGINIDSIKTLKQLYSCIKSRKEKYEDGFHKIIGIKPKRNNFYSPSATEFTLDFISGVLISECNWNMHSCGLNAFQTQVLLMFLEEILS